MCYLCGQDWQEWKNPPKIKCLSATDRGPWKMTDQFVQVKKQNIIIRLQKYNVNQAPAVPSTTSSNSMKYTLGVLKPKASMWPTMNFQPVILLLTLGNLRNGPNFGYQLTSCQLWSEKLIYCMRWSVIIF